MKKLRISPLEFKHSSATVRFFGKPVSVDLHLVAAKIPKLKMICPNNLIENEKPCKICAAEHGVYGVRTSLTLAWDCRAKKWIGFPAESFILKQIFDKSKAAGATISLMESGLGPDVHLQKMLGVLETEVDAATIGLERGSNPPSMPEFLAAVQRQSIWLKYDSAQAVMNKFPYPPPVQPASKMSIFTPDWSKIGNGPISGVQFIKIIDPEQEQKERDRDSNV